MAGPLTHIALTEKVYDELFNNHDRRKFYVGTSFPDIRYLGGIERDKTHTKNLRLEDVLAETDSFQAGAMFHSLVDEARSNFVRQRQVYELLPKSQYVGQATKFYEDILMRPQISNPQRIADYFETVLAEELAFGIAAKQIEQWHDILRTTLIQPDAAKLESVWLKLGFNHAASEEIVDLVSRMEHIPEIQASALEFYSNFPSRLR